MATTVARQIKQDFPDCHLTWAIGYKCKQVIENNPYVDAIWSVEYATHELPHADVWDRTKALAEYRRREGEFDQVFYTQIFPENVERFDGTTRSSIFRSYPGKITVPVQPVLRLVDDERERVTAFAVRHELATYRQVILFECSPSSHQSALSLEIAIEVAQRVIAQRPDTAFILSTHQSFQSPHRAIIDGSSLTYRENAELSKHCTLLLGCSSGITWLLTSDWAKRLPTIQFLSETPPWFAFASVKYDHRNFGLDTSHILETNVSSVTEIAATVERYLAQGTFAGLPSVDLAPSVEQIYGLYRMMQGRVAIRQVLRNFLERNRDMKMSDAAFLYRIARLRLRLEAGTLKRRLIAVVSRANP
jgi:ADP-heptose:LPS heptosyltransferase